MPKTIFAIIAIGLASPAGAAQLTVAEKLSDIMNSKEQIRQAIESRGVSVPSNTPLSQYAAKIGRISCPVSSAIGPSSCSSSPETYNVNELTVIGCSGGNAGGSPISTFVVGGYCSSSAGDNIYASVQACSGCVAATTASGSQGHCYCKIHSINGLAVAASSRFMFGGSGGGGSASICANRCAFHCAYDARLYSNFRSALFSALGS